MTTYFRVVWPIILPSIIQPPLDLSLASTTLIGLSHFLRHGVSLRNIMKGEESLLNSNSLEYTPLQPSYRAFLFTMEFITCLTPRIYLFIDTCF